MADANTIFLANQPLLNALLAHFYAQDPHAFAGEKIEPLGGLDYTFAATAAPTMDLSPQKNGSQFAVRFDSVRLDTYAFRDGKRGARINTEPVHVQVTGSFELRDGALAITGLKATGSNVLDKHAAAMINNTLLPKYTTALSSLPLPDFRKLMGIQMTITGVGVTGGLLRATAAVEGGGSLPPEPAAETSRPAVTVAVGPDAINNYLRPHFGHPSASDSGSHSKIGWGYRWSASASAANPRITISGNHASGSLDVSASARGGIEGFWKWTDVGLSVSIRTPPIGVKVEAVDANHAAVSFYLDGHIGIDFGLPGLLEKVADSIMAGVNQITGKITSAVNGALAGVVIPIFTLPSTIPGTSYGAKLGFEQLGVANGAVRAVVSIG